MGSRKSIIREAIERLDSLMAIGQSRFQAKQARRATSADVGWTVSTGKIHSHTTRKVYQQHVLAFINWARTTHGITRLVWLDERADELVTQYLTEHVAADRSAYTLQTERAALRLFFGDWGLAAAMRIPRRTRTAITRSRGPAGHDRHFQPANWQAHIRIAQACGLRRAELRDLRVRDVYIARDGTLFVHVKHGKGGKAARCPYSPATNRMCWPSCKGGRLMKRSSTTFPGTWMCTATGATRRNATTCSRRLSRPCLRLKGD